ncbi:ABC transporter permease [Erythrobacteraceae bacterium CFH 75059]|uniref:ABC transporter permease n=1 Tax=Qipengyuania thermophila TaxID=2509361 RepID=UPI001021C0FA|nr:ABC transporter permease [Qipengyuania thermophila]TCD06580.1 ABC transporter permease [Erythrobacteraceae bacterium CFH 75059]
MSRKADSPRERLSLPAAAMVVAQRDFLAILLSRTFLLFLLGPLFPVAVAALAGGIGDQMRGSVGTPALAVTMPAGDAARVVAARRHLGETVGVDLPEVRVIPAPPGGAAALLGRPELNAGAVLTGTLAEPVLLGPEDRLQRWQGLVRLLLAEARSTGTLEVPALALAPARPSTSDARRDRMSVAQGGQLLLFLLSMLLAGMVLSNLVEEKGNKIIEILAASIPMDAVFLGKLFAMLAISFVGIAVWAAAGGALLWLARDALPPVPAPAVGWPLFALLFVLYFALNYLLLGAIFLAIGSLAASVREVQTLSMPVTMSQMLIFFLGNLAVANPDGGVAWAATAFPLSSPYAMVSRAAQEPGLGVHALALAWQVLFVALFIRGGATLFRRRVMHSGAPRRPWRERLRLRRGRDAAELTSV